MEANIKEKEKPYTLGKLGGKHLFTFTTILRKIGFKELKECFESDEIMALINDKNVNIEKVGINIMMNVAVVVISNLENCESDIYKLLSDLSGMSKKELSELDMDIFVEMIMDVFRKEEFRGFFKAASKLFN